MFINNFSDGCLLSLVSSRYVGLIAFNKSFSFGDVMYLNTDNTLLHVVSYECCSPGIPSHAARQCWRATTLYVLTESTFHDSTQTNSIAVIFKHISFSVFLKRCCHSFAAMFVTWLMIQNSGAQYLSLIMMSMIIIIFDFISCAWTNRLPCRAYFLCLSRQLPDLLHVTNTSATHQQLN